MKVYLAGKMRGIQDFNFPAFYWHAEQLREMGHEVFNPAEIDEQEYGHGFAKSKFGDLADIPHFNLREALLKDVTWILQHAEAIALIPGWEDSSGVRAELALARTIGLTVIHLPIIRHRIGPFDDVPDYLVSD